MKELKKPPIINSLSYVVDMFFDANKECNVSNSVPYFVILFLSMIAPEGYKVIISASSEFLDDNTKTLCKNGFIEEKIDNLKNIFIRKHKIKEDGKKDIYFTTSMVPYREKFGKYSYFLRDLVMNLATIEHISYQKMSEIVELFTGIEVSRQRIFDIIERNFDSFYNECFDEINKQIKELGINPGEVVHYDEEFIWINHQPHVRLTIINALNRVVIADNIIPRDSFNTEYIKLFLKTSLKDYPIRYIVTDGDVRYPKIISELGYIQQRCTFHLMKNLMDSLSPRHLSLRRKIKALDKKIPLKEKELEELYK